MALAAGLEPAAEAVLRTPVAAAAEASLVAAMPALMAVAAILTWGTI
jgi:hypothetical protein